MTGYRIPEDIYLSDFDTTDALCAQTDPELFFPDKGDSQSAVYAKQICNKCFLIEECLTEALNKRYDEGIWGGTSPRERRYLLQRIDSSPSIAPVLVAKAVARLQAHFQQEEERKEMRRQSEKERRRLSDMARRAK